jgi:hypothetical protein
MMNEIEARVRCLELAEKTQIKIGDRSIEKILETSEKFCQHVLQRKTSAEEAPTAQGGEEIKKPRKRNRKKQGQAEEDPFS